MRSGRLGRKATLRVWRRRPGFRGLDGELSGWVQVDVFGLRSSVLGACFSGSGVGQVGQVRRATPNPASAPNFPEPFILPLINYHVDLRLRTDKLWRC